MALLFCLWYFYSGWLLTWRITNQKIIYSIPSNFFLSSAQVLIRLSAAKQINDTKIPNVKPIPAPFGLDKHPIIIWPKSSVPIKAPKTIIINAKIKVWFIPNIICGNASGNSIDFHLWKLDTPDIDAASCKDDGTLLNPSTVYLVAGTEAYAIAAIITDVSVIPKRRITGIRYIKEGKVWKKSQIESIILVAKLLRAHNEPTTIPKNAEMPTAKVAI